MINRVWILRIVVGLTWALSAQETTHVSRVAVVQTSLDMFTATSSDWRVPGAWNLTVYGGAALVIMWVRCSKPMSGSDTIWSRIVRSISN